MSYEDPIQQVRVPKTRKIKLTEKLYDKVMQRNQTRDGS